jgi:hypothetical protein
VKFVHKTLSSLALLSLKSHFSFTSQPCTDPDNEAIHSFSEANSLTHLEISVLNQEMKFTATHIVSLFVCVVFANGEGKASLRGECRTKTDLIKRSPHHSSSEPPSQTHSHNPVAAADMWTAHLLAFRLQTNAV